MPMTKAEVIARMRAGLAASRAAKKGVVAEPAVAVGSETVKEDVVTVQVPSALRFEMDQWCDRHGWSVQTLTDLLASMTVDAFDRTTDWSEWPVVEADGSPFGKQVPVDVPISRLAAERLAALCAAIGVHPCMPLSEAWARAQPFLHHAPVGRNLVSRLNGTFSAFARAQRATLARAS